MSLTLQTMFILHKRPYRETSLLLDCLTEHDGLISVLAKGAKRPKSPLRAVMTSFVPLSASWYGRGELKVLRQAERMMTLPPLLGRQLYSGFYLNELLLKALHKYDPCPAIFNLYQQTIATELAEADLRRFELNLLIDLGYALDLQHEAHTGCEVEAGARYFYQPGVGLTAYAGQEDDAAIFLGEHLLAIASDNYLDQVVLRSAKRLTRLALFPLVGHHKFKSRELFV